MRRSLIAVLFGAMLPIVAVSGLAHAGEVCSGSASNILGAASMARRCGTWVEALSSRTQTAQTFVNHDGTVRLEQFAYPQRIRRPDGAWVALDPTLTANRDGSLSPRASTVDLMLSGGGAQKLLTTRTGERQVTLSWSGVLPKPVVSGARATYPEVLPGVDLVVTAQDTGFNEVFVVKNRVAAANPALRKLAFGSSLTGLTWQNDNGRLKAVDKAGSPLLASSAPRMWDASGTAAGVRQGIGGRTKGDLSGPAQGARSAEIQLDLVGNAVTLAPDRSMLDDPSVVFPLYLDPTLSNPSWTMINNGAPAQSYWSYDRNDCPTPFTGQCAKVGRVFGGSMVYRSMFQFPTSGFHGLQVIDATFSIDLLYSASPTKSTTELRQINGEINSATTWNNTAGRWGGAVATVLNSSWPAARKLTEFGGSLASTLQGVASSSAQTTTWGLKSDDESSDSGWKKFDATTAKLVITTNTLPNTPDMLTVDGRACVSGASRPVIATATPTLRSRVTDNDGDSMKDFFAWAKFNGSTFVDVGSSSMSPVVNGGTGAVTTGALGHGGIYTFRSQSNDSPSHSGVYGTSPVTNVPGNCEWEVDLVDPNLPTVTADTYTEGCQSCGGVGQTGHFGFASSSDVTTFRWGLTSPPTNTVTALGGAGGLDWTPAAGGAQTLFVQAVDRAGRSSIVKNFQFYVAPAAPLLASWLLNDAVGSTAAADDTGNAHTASVTGTGLGAKGRIVPGPDGFSRSSMQFSGSGSVVSAPTVLNTSTSLSVTAWVKLADTTATHTVISAYGSNRGAFYLRYSPGVGRWTFDITSSDGPSFSVSTAPSDAPPATGVWTHLVGVYDAGSKDMTLYVNGTRQVSHPTGVTTWSATAGMTIGKSLAGESMAGSICEVKVWNRVLSSTEAADLSDPRKVSKVGEWLMESVGNGPEFDSSDMGRDLRFFNGATIPASNSGHTGTGMHLDGVDDYASPSAQVIYTDQSFTVSLWVRMNDKSTSHNIITQSGTSTSPFYLQYNVYYDRWMLNTGSQDVSPAWSDAPRSTTVPVLGQWTHLTGVYDADLKRAQLYVNDVLEGTATGVTMWSSSGAFEIGKGFAGDVDEVQVFQGALRPV